MTYSIRWIRSKQKTAAEIIGKWFGASMSKRQRLIEEAAVLFMRLQEDDAQPEDWNAYQQWMAISNRHKQIMFDIESFWEDSGQLDRLSWPSTAECELDDYNGDIPVAEHFETVSKKSGMGKGVDSTQNPLAARWKPVFASVLFLAFVSTTLLWSLVDGLPQSYSTEVGEHRLVTLEDGSEVLLGGRSSIQVEYTQHLRVVSLESGEALFTVAKDKARPFKVRVSDALVTAVGTQFNIRKAANRVVVSVTEGVVRVSSQVDLDDLKLEAPDISRKELIAGQRVSYGRRGKVSPIEEVSISEVVSWRDGQLIYIDQPLREVIADINRYHDTEVVIVAPSVAELMFTGAVRKDEIKDWLNGLAAVFPLRLEREGKQVLVASLSQTNVN